MHRTRSLALPSSRSRRPVIPALLLFGVVGSAACGSPPPPAPPVAPPPSPVVVVPPAPDLTAVPEPEGLVAFARASKPSEALKVIGGWVQFPVPGPAEVAALVTGESFANLVDLDQPIDFALAFRGRQTRGAISVGVRSLDEAKLAFSKYKLVPTKNGALRIDGLGKPDDEDKDGDEGEARVCELVPSVSAAERGARSSDAPAAPTATRLICAESEPTLRDLGPWLSRTAPRQTYPSDVHLELRLAPIRPAVDQMRRALPMLAGPALGLRHTGVPELDDTFRAAIDDVADFASDADTVAIDTMIGEPQATVTLTSRFRSTTSLLARLAVAHPDHAAAPPPAFWKLPADSDSAFFHGGIDAADFDKPRDHLVDVLGAALAQGGLPEPDRKAIREATTHLLDLFALRSEYAKGLDVAGAQKALAAMKAVKETDRAAHDEAARHVAEQMAGWLAIGIDAPAAKLGAVEKEWAAAWSRPGVAKFVHSGAKEGPNGREGLPPMSVRMAPLPAGIAGKDAAHMEVAVRVDYPAADAKDASEKSGKSDKKKPAASGKPIVLHALVVPDGTASWLVLAADEKLAVAKAKDLVSGGTATLASRPGLASMKDAHMNAGGFVSARALSAGDVFSWTFDPAWDSLAKDLFGGPDAGDQASTAIPLQFTSEPPTSGSPAGTFVATATVPRAAIGAIVRKAIH